jgi:hypothetical protein
MKFLNGILSALCLAGSSAVFAINYYFSSVLDLLLDIYMPAWCRMLLGGIDTNENQSFNCKRKYIDSD